jgi:hypothetical protein
MLLRIFYPMMWYKKFLKCITTKMGNVAMKILSQIFFLFLFITIESIPVHTCSSYITSSDKKFSKALYFFLIYTMYCSNFVVNHWVWVHDMNLLVWIKVLKIYSYIVLNKKFKFTGPNKVLLFLGRRTGAHREDCNIPYSSLQWISLLLKQICMNFSDLSLTKEKT